MNTPLSFVIYQSASELPENWDTIAKSTIFLQKDYFEILEYSCPSNMKCFFIGVFQNKELVGVALSQFLDLNKLESFGERDQCLKTIIRNFAFKRFSSHVLFLGNCMLTGENAYSFLDFIPYNEQIKVLHEAQNKIEGILKNQGIPIHLRTSKDFSKAKIDEINQTSFGSIFQFTTQPNMIFSIPEHWKKEQDYINALAKKYRDQYKRARKKGEGVLKRKLSLTEIEQNQELIYDLYYHVAKNAPFNSFFLAKNHFSVLKKVWKENFLFYGYFNDEKLIGFNTLIKNGDTMDTYFLGYDDTIQREKMLYLNMLYDMIAYSIKKEFKTIIFARTALEIKSSVGAIPETMYGLMEHKNPILNYFLPHFFYYLEPKTIWKERNPFK
ncbi:8-amino-7-oxononanoate synthase [Flavobacterium polysaccharolyticum]|uniref:8-amino-7-oxononanoate synthase n=1 Tax=Flavobacterium polysaccharolyticum TaxID=3133148 RepID=A0ABU9NTD6_9FLAO